MLDIIGDIHGHADALTALLQKLGYRERNGAWRHQDRTAIFVGDLIDRGPKQMETIRIVRAMVDAASAQIVLGNHEYNALAWATPNPNAPGHFMRDHSAKNRNQHRVFLEQVGEKPALHEECLRFFESMPLWLDLPAVRIVHACWHPAHQETLRPQLVNGTLNRELLHEIAADGSDSKTAVDTMLKGLEVALPDGITFQDKDGHIRQEVRVKWWLGSEVTFRECALIDDDTRQRLPATLLPVDQSLVDEDSRPTFFGHYWFEGPPALMTSTAACVDWSVAAGGRLAAYRFDGEPALQVSNFVTVDP